MRNLLLCLLALACAPVFAEEPEAGAYLDEQFLRAYQLSKEAETLEQKQQYKPAVKALEQALALLEDITKRVPGQDGLVQYRTTRTREILARVRKEAGLPEPAKRASTAAAAEAPPRLAKGKPQDPSELFLDGYRWSQQADRLSDQQDLEHAAEALIEAERLLSALTVRRPKWNPSIVAYRLGRVRAALQKVQHGQPIGEPEQVTVEFPAVP